MLSRVADSIALPAKTRSPGAGKGHGKLEHEVTGLFDQYREPLLRYLWSSGLPVSDGEEILQDVFLSLFRHLAGGKSLDNTRGWLFRVARNLALKRRYRLRRESFAAADSDLTVDPAPDPEVCAAHSQAQRRLMSVVDALPEQDRQCLFLRADGLRYREIAEVLDMSLGAVSLSLSRSLARIGRSTERSGL